MRGLTAFLVVITLIAMPPARALEAETNVYEVLESARQALLAEKYVDAGKAMEKVLKMPAFAELEPALQYQGLQMAAFAASGRKDYLGEHEFLVVLTEFAEADAGDWMRRAYAAAQIDAWQDSALALQTVTKRWPKEMRGKEVSHDLVRATVSELDGDKHRKERLALLEALYEARYTFEWDTEPAIFWRELVEEALARNDVKRARAIAGRITLSSAIVAMRIDRRFDALVAAEPKLFDVRAVAEREVKRLRAVTGANPRALNALMQYCYALLEVGRFDEVLALAGAAIERVNQAPEKSPPYDDLDDLNWIYNHKASALRALGRPEEAVLVLETGAKKQEKGSVNVSQAINLGMYYVDMGKPKEALRALEGVDWGRSLSPYGRTQLQYVRYDAYLQLADKEEADKVLAWFREHAADSRETVQMALLDGGDLDGAAALLIERLRDASERPAALSEVQTFESPPRTTREAEFEARRQALFARADVTAAIAEVGRREKFAIYNLQF